MENVHSFDRRFQRLEWLRWPGVVRAGQAVTEAHPSSRQRTLLTARKQECSASRVLMRPQSRPLDTLGSSSRWRAEAAPLHRHVSSTWCCSRRGALRPQHSQHLRCNSVKGLHG